MVYLAELLVVITDWLKTVRIRARNVPCVHGHKHLDHNMFLMSLSRSRKVTPMLADAPGCRLVEHKKNCILTTYACVASEQESCWDSMPSSL